MKILDPLALNLHSRHLIEASAGTGKTFNITRLYARLVLEKRLPVQQILVMTFTKAATEEIKSRVAAFLRELADDWEKEKPDTFTQELISITGIEEGRNLLTAALLSMDEAAIFTIHGFCQRVLKQFAVSLNMELEPELLNDTAPMSLQAVQDWVRSISHDSDKLLALAEQDWHDPAAFHRSFQTAFDSQQSLSRPSLKDIVQSAYDNIFHWLDENDVLDDSLLKSVTEHRADLFEAVVSHHKDCDKRSEEYAVLEAWLKSFSALSSLQVDYTGEQESLIERFSEFVDQIVAPEEVGQFIQGGRYGKFPELKAALEPVREFRKKLNAESQKWRTKLLAQLRLAQVLDIAEEGIVHVQKNLKRAKEQAQTLSFNDLVRQLAQALDSGNQTLIDAVRAQYPVALVDEFQDTDSHQYKVLDLLYPRNDPTSLLVMIGDPKQAIYGFRGGDIFVYLKAKQEADEIWMMDTNWRSSDAMITAYNRIFWGHSLREKLPRPVFGQGIDYEIIHSTDGAKAAKHPLFDPSKKRSAVTYMVASDGARQDAQSRLRNKPAELESQIVDWSCFEIQRLLAETKIGNVRTKPSDIAILVKDGIQADIMQQGLSQKGLSSVYLSQKKPLFESAEAIEIYRVLLAIHKHKHIPVLSAGLTSSMLANTVLNENNELGASADPRLLVSDMLKDPLHPSWDNLSASCESYLRLWENEGVFSLLMHLIKANYQPALKPERSITNMMHVAESLASIATLNKLPEQQLAWLGHQVFDHTTDDELQLRLESDANLIKIVTLHGSKGLEYPVVFVPFANKYKDPSMRRMKPIQYFRYQDPQTHQAIYQLGATAHSVQHFVAQSQEEDVRLLYVAITRAEHRCYLGLVDDIKTANSSLNRSLGIPSRVLNSSNEKEAASNTLLPWMLANVCENKQQNSANEETVTCNHNSLIVVGDGFLELEAPAFANRDKHTEHEPQLMTAFETLAVGTRLPWIISSFSNISRFTASHDNEHFDIAQPKQLTLHKVESNLEHKTHAREYNNTEQNLPTELRFTLKKGAETGNLLHDILENVDFSNANWAEASQVALTKFTDLDDNDKDALFVWLEACLLSPLKDGLRLADLSLSQTLREAEFYFPMANVNVQALGRVLNDYRDSRAAKFRCEALKVNMQHIQDLQGMMHGFIDLIFEHQGRYFVADYKSTHLGNDFESYSFLACHENNQQHLYDLQYLLYSLALHKYLKATLPNYQFEQHFGGVYYFYLRGMAPESPVYKVSNELTCHSGVFFDDIEFVWLERLQGIFEGPEHTRISDDKQGIK
ncbi:exodeoxyribonuclease V subunit beta [Alteromonas sp. W364]|uniref:exodeoxyribonuclease V subunit beta n=1 Tax=Alteromonas sp. W364 TaxID=3075610 RepID=UPI002886B32B|nr:exodeoxyribonuclease V subunit beta [Alteromonas sp. W364]MDT0626851.1 exodeoxyribonuclease V subunit beta [Alteromonas sp. W364]